GTSARSRPADAARSLLEPGLHGPVVRDQLRIQRSQRQRPLQAHLKARLKQAIDIAETQERPDLTTGIRNPVKIESRNPGGAHLTGVPGIDRGLEAPLPLPA